MMANSEQKMQSHNAMLGDFITPRASFPDLDNVFSEFASSEFKKNAIRKRFHRVNQVLLKLIQDAPSQSFLLPAVIEYIAKINEKHILPERYHLSIFEFWLNQFSELDEKQNYEVRSKIIGKYIPRDDYQAFFPIGMNKTFNGSHYVAAHLSPDVDTMVASFWGWVDAFAARVGDSRHLWSLPGGPPDSPVTQTFKDYFGKDVFGTIARQSVPLTLSAIDLLTQKGYIKKTGNASLSTLDTSGEKAVILVDDEGYFQGDWHSRDVEPIRKIIIRFKSCLRWFENNLHVKLISLFTKEKLHVKDIKPFLSSVFDVKIYDCEPVKEFTERQKKDIDDFFSKVIGLEKGLQGTFRELNAALAKLSSLELSQFQEVVESLEKSDLFDSSGYLREDRPAIFHAIEKIINQLDKAIHYIRDYAEQLDVAMYIKSKVFGLTSEAITMWNDVEDIRIKIKNQEYLTVVIQEENDSLFPIGVVWANTLNNTILGTVSFRDFCNQEEVKMASYLSPISVVDHHKSSLRTNSPPMAIIGDAQSCNVLIAEQMFNINAPYSLGGMSANQIEGQLNKLRDAPNTLENMRLRQRLAQRQMAAKTAGDYFIHPNRELIEYICFLHAILDDTDLLTKVSKRDITCVVELLNRIKSLTMNCEIEVVNLDDIPQNKDFARSAAKRLLRNPEMYSFYRKVYESKEQEVQHNLQAVREDHLSYLFLDTKEQNGCCRVGQTKLFSSNFALFRESAPKIMEYWFKNAQTIQRDNPQIDLHLHMISTIASAEEVYQDNVGQYQHQDELWFWSPATQKGNEHLSSFLIAFQAAHKLGSSASIEFLKGVPDELQQVFNRNCAAIPRKKSTTGLDLPIVILRFKAGLMNSRKAMITPYLPRIIS